MTFTFSEKQIGSSSTSASTIANTALGSGVTTSQFVVGAVVYSNDATDSITISSVKDNAGTPNTYPLIGSLVSSAAVAGTSVQLFSLDAPPGSPTILTATLSAATNLRAIYVGVFNRGAAVTTDVHNTSTGNSATPTGPSIAPSGANELIFAATAEDAGVTLVAETSPLAYTILEQDTLQIGGSEYFIETTQTTDSPSFTTSPSTASTWAVAAAAFKEGGGVVFIPRVRRYQPVVIPIQLWRH